MPSPPPPLRPEGAAGRLVRAHAWVIPGAWLSLASGIACRAPAPPSPPSPSKSAPVVSAHSSTPSAGPPDSTAAPDAALPRTCSITVQVLETGGLTGHGRSDASGKAAKDAAWSDACAQLRQAHDLDCRDEDAVAVEAEGSSTLRVAEEDGTSVERWEHRVTLTPQRRATGFSDAPERTDACRRAKEHACRQLVAGPCPEGRTRVVEVDGRPPRPAAVEPARRGPTTTPTTI